MEFLAEITPLFTAYRYFVLFPISIVEGPIITVVAGFLSVQGLLVWFWAYLTVVIGDLVGDAIYYSLGRWGRKRLIRRWGKYLGIYEKEVEKLEKHFREHAGKTLLAGKWTHVGGTIVLVTAGISKMPFGIYMGYEFIGTLVKSGILFAVGYFIGSAIKRIDSFFQMLALVSIGVAISVVGYLIYRGYKNRTSK